MAGWRETEESHDAAPSDAAQPQRDLRGRENLGYRTNGRDCWRRPERARAGRADLGYIQTIDRRDDFIAGEDPAEGDQLPGNLFAAGGGGFERRKQRHLHLRFGPPDFRIVQVQARLAQAVERDRQQFSDIFRARCGIKAKHAGIGISPMIGMDGVGKPARLAHLLEQPRRHSAADRVRENLQGVKILVRVSRAFEADGDMGLFEPPLQALFAAPVECPCGTVFSAPRRKLREAPLGLVAKRSMFDCSGGANHRRAGCDSEFAR